MMTIYRALRQSVALVLACVITVAAFAGVRYMRCDRYVNIPPDASKCDPYPGCATFPGKCTMVTYTGPGGQCVNASYLYECDNVAPFSITEQKWVAVCLPSSPVSPSGGYCYCPDASDPSAWTLIGTQTKVCNCP